MNNNYINKETKKIIKKNKFNFIYKLVTSSLLRGFLLIIPIFFSIAIDNVALKNYDKAVSMSLVAMGIAVLYYIVQALDHRTFYKIYSKLYQDYTSLAYNSIKENSIHSMSRFTLSEYINIVNNDVDKIATLFTGAPFRFIRVLEFLVIYIYFYFVNPNIFLIAIVISALMFLLLYKTSEKTKQNNSIAKNVYDKKTNVVHEYFENLKEIKSFNIYKSFGALWNNATEKYTDANYKFFIFASDIKILILGFLELSKYLVTIYGIFLIKDGNLEIGSLLVIYAYFSKLIDNFDIFGTITTDIRDLQVSLNRFNKLLEFRGIKKDKAVKMDDCNGHIIFSDVLYGNINDPILDNVSFELLPNSLSVVTGKTGSGKSGIFELLIRLNRQHYGDVLIDDVSFSDIDEEDYHSMVSLVTQDPKFFDLSIKDNLLMLDSDFNKIKEMAKYFRIDEYIESLPNGYNTYINDKAVNIPNNVKIILAIIRVLIKNPRIMLFDEVISSLDKKSEKLFIQALLKLKEEHTVVVITREQDIASISDKIIVMDKNQVVETGTYDELSNTDSYYRKLYSIE